MSDERGNGQPIAGPGAAAQAPARPRRESLLARSPAFAMLALALCGWLLWDLSPEVAFFFSAGEPIDLGGPGAYRLERARENRLVRVRGELAQAIPVTEERTGDPRTVGRIAGTGLVVDRPGRGGAPVFEGRLLPASGRAEYRAVVAAMRERGAPIDDRYLVLRDGERPRKRWLPAAGSAILALLALLNLRALVKHLSAQDGRRR